MNDRDLDLDLRLRTAGARLRSDGPSAAETDHALRTLERPAPRTPWRWAGPALFAAAAAAAVIGAFVITQPEDTLRQVPADSRTPPTAASTTAAPIVVPGTGTVPATVPSVSLAPASVPPASAVPAGSAPVGTTTTTTATSVAPAAGWIVSVVTADFDGEGGACVEVAAAGRGRVAGGCVPGQQVSEGRPAYAVVAGDGRHAVLAVTTDGTTGAAVDVPAVDASNVCVPPIDAGGRLVDVVRCVGQTGLYALLAPSPDERPDWMAGRGGFAPPLPMTPVTVDVAPGVLAFEYIGTTAGGDERRCVAVTAEGEPGWREGCAPAGDSRPFLAGFGLTQLYVEVDAERRVTGITALDPGVVPLANGCPVGIGTLLASVPSGATVGLRCVDGAAITAFSPTLVSGGGEGGGTTLHRDAGDGTWPIGDVGPSLTCARYAQTCAAFGATTELGEAMLPLPPLDVLTGFVDPALDDDLLPPQDVTASYTDLGVVADAEALFDAVVADRRAGGDEESDLAPGSFTTSPLVITVTGIPDDSVGGEVLALWWSPAEGGIAVDAAVSVPSCTRGVTTLDDGTPACV